MEMDSDRTPPYGGVLSRLELRYGKSAVLRTIASAAAQR